MKNVLIIDGVENCEYSIFAMTDDEFRVVFPGDRQNVEFIEDLVDRIGDDGVASLFKTVWRRKVPKADVIGIYGTIFFSYTGRRNSIQQKMIRK